MVSRGLPNPAQDIGPKASALGGVVATQARSAVAAAETIASQGLQNIPKGCSVGTTNGCILYDGRSDCTKLPIKKSAFLGSIASVAPPVEILNGMLSHTPPLEVFLWLGLACTVASTIAYAFRYSFPRARLVSAGLSLLGFLFLLIFAVFTFAIVELVKGLERAGSMHRGAAYVGAIGDVTSAFAHVAVSMTSLWCGL